MNRENACSLKSAAYDFMEGIHAKTQRQISFELFRVISWIVLTGSINDPRNNERRFQKLSWTADAQSSRNNLKRGGQAAGELTVHIQHDLRVFHGRPCDDLPG